MTCLPAPTIEVLDTVVVVADSELAPSIEAAPVSAAELAVERDTPVVSAEPELRPFLTVDC